MAFQSPIDIANRALQHISQTKISAFADVSRAAKEINTAYDDLRLAELSRHTWAFSIRRARCRAITLTTQVWTPPTYSASTAYTVGQVSMYAGGSYANSANYPWILQVPTSTGDLPDISPKWSHYFGPLVADIFDSGQVYAAGEIAIVPPVYAAGTTYPLNAIVIDGSNNMWVSLQASNIGHTPSTSPTYWTPWILPSSGQPSTTPTIVFFSAPSVFLSISNNNGPVSPAVNVTTFPSASAYWTSVGGTVAQLTILWPLNVGPATDTTTANLYRLPFGWLRPSTIPLGNKQTSRPWLGALYGTTDSNADLTYQGQYFSVAGGPGQSPQQSWGIFRDIDFVADIADVTAMPPPFCETLAVRIARDIDGPIAEDKHAQKLARLYKQVTGEAMRVDAILQGDPVEDLDDLIRVRF